jgi:EAL domain-containing protein (putative c-di-GMP-specific phosphodiesterase class I)
LLKTSEALLPKAKCFLENKRSALAKALCFLENLRINQRVQSIFGVLMKVATDHGITVLAEGVETLPEVEWVMESGAHLAQGYFCGKSSAEPIMALLG